MADQNDTPRTTRTQKTPEPSRWGRDRHKTIAEADLDPLSLIGSYFHVLHDEEIVEQGLVVGQPDPGIYLCECWDSHRGASRYQRLVANKQMGYPEDGREWRFYDNEDWMRGAYVEWTTHQERETA